MKSVNQTFSTALLLVMESAIAQRVDMSDTHVQECMRYHVGFAGSAS